jgi:hypothetical protein
VQIFEQTELGKIYGKFKNILKVKKGSDFTIPHTAMNHQ